MGLWAGMEGSAPRPGASNPDVPNPDASNPLAPGTVAFRPGVVVTLDGPAGSGKSTTAREVARRLRYRHLDSGALYRALTLALLEKGIRMEEWEGVTAADLEGLRLSLEPTEEGFQVLLNGRAPGPELRSPEVTRAVPSLARIPAVRDHLRILQRTAGTMGGLVAEGRDMGTVIFPDAPCKIFLTASLAERARRRLTQEGREPTAEAIQAEAARIQARDAIDESREAAPLRVPDGALAIDTTGLTFDEQVGRIVQAVERLTSK